MNTKINQVKEPTVPLYQKLCNLVEIQPVAGNITLVPFSEAHKMAERNKSERLTAAIQVFIDKVIDFDEPIHRVDKLLIDRFICEIDEMMGSILDGILHHEAFLKLESTWRGLHYLVEHTDFQANTKVQLLDVDKETLRDDFLDVSSVTQSGLYRHVYVDEYDTPGGKPISAILSDYEFDSNHDDITLLNQIAHVAAASHSPFLGSVGPKFFNKHSMDEVSRIIDLKDHMDRPEFIRWNCFRDNEDSRYIGLLLPNFLLRLPYGESNVVRGFCYQEKVNQGGGDSFCFGKPIFPFGANLIRSFKNHGWTVSIRGPEAGGKVENLPLHQYDMGRGFELKIPTEILIPETRELEFSELGFIPLSYYKDSNFACFFSANSVHRPKLYDSKIATANSRINSRLPYIFLAARLGHYLKVLQRENIGGAKDQVTLEKELNQWISGLVTEMPNPGLDLLANRPLRDGKVVVEVIPDNPGFYRVNLFATPHFQVEGIDVRLSLVSKMPGASNS